jgi:urease accessory protein UreH
MTSIVVRAAVCPARGVVLDEAEQLVHRHRHGAYHHQPREGQRQALLRTGALHQVTDARIARRHLGQPFERGSFCQHIELPGVWLERGRIDAADERLLDSPLGLAGNRCLASIFFCTGDTLGRTRQQAALDAARRIMDQHVLCGTAGATSPNDHVVVVRVLAPLVEPAMDLLRKVWAAWRQELWRVEAQLPRIWAT